MVRLCPTSPPLPPHPPHTHVPVFYRRGSPPQNKTFAIVPNMEALDCIIRYFLSTFVSPLFFLFFPSSVFFLNSRFIYNKKARAVVLANKMDAALEELGVNERKLKEFVESCVDRLKAKDTVSMKTLKMQAHFLNHHRTHAEVKRSRRAKTEVVADDEHPQKILFAKDADACPPKDMVAGMKAIGIAVAVRDSNMPGRARARARTQ